MSENDRSLTKEEKDACLLKLKELIIQDSKEEVLNKISSYEKNDLFEHYLNGTNFDVNEAFDRLQTIYKLMRKYPAWFAKHGPLAQKELIDQEVRFGLTATDKEGRPIYVIRTGKIDVNSMTLADLFTVDDIWFEWLLMKHGSKKGLCVILDVADQPWNLLKWLTPHNIKTQVKKLNNLPFKEYRYHVVNDCMFFRAAVNVIWPFVPGYIQETAQFHYNNKESLFNFIDAQVLPPMYGGTNLNWDYAKLCEDLYAQNEQIYRHFQKYRC